MKPFEMAPAMELALAASFGSVPLWRDALVMLDRSVPDAGGCLQLAFLPPEGRLVNRWSALEVAADEAAVVLLALRRPVEAALEGLDWDAVYTAYQHAVEAASSACAATQADLGGALLLDVRRAGVFEKAAALIPGARWCDPADVGRWGATLPRDREVVVYCVYGHEVGRATALRLRAAGVRARYLAGGIDGWQSAGLPVQAKGGAA